MPYFEKFSFFTFEIYQQNRHTSLFLLRTSFQKCHLQKIRQKHIYIYHFLLYFMCGYWYSKEEETHPLNTQMTNIIYVRCTSFDTAAINQKYFGTETLLFSNWVILYYICVFSCLLFMYTNTHTHTHSTLYLINLLFFCSSFLIWQWIGTDSIK